MGYKYLHSKTNMKSDTERTIDICLHPYSLVTIKYNWNTYYLNKSPEESLGDTMNCSRLDHYAFQKYLDNYTTCNGIHIYTGCIFILPRTFGRVELVLTSWDAVFVPFSLFVCKAVKILSVAEIIYQSFLKKYWSSIYHCLHWKEKKRKKITSIYTQTWVVQ